MCDMPSSEGVRYQGVNGMDSGLRTLRRTSSRAAGQTVGPAELPQDAEALRAIALRLDYMIGQITPEEFHWQDANYDRDCALGRELLFLIANDDWVRATSETVNIARSDTIDTNIDIDVDFNRISHEAFRDRAGQIWLPVVVLPPLGQLPEPDPFSTLTVTDASGSPLMVLPHADVRHRAAAALTEIILSVAVARLPEVSGRSLRPVGPIWISVSMLGHTPQSKQGVQRQSSCSYCDSASRQSFQSHSLSSPESRWSQGRTSGSSRSRVVYQPRSTPTSAHAWTQRS